MTKGWMEELKVFCLPLNLFFSIIVISSFTQQKIYAIPTNQKFGTNIQI